MADYCEYFGKWIPRPKKNIRALQPQKQITKRQKKRMKNDKRGEKEKTKKKEK